MNDPRTTRAFQERFLDGYNRSQLRRDIQNAKPQQFSSRRKTYAAMALGVSLTLGGLVPLNLYQSIDVVGNREAPPAATERRVPQLDLQTAEEIALRLERRVNRGVATVSDQITADFFLKQVPFGSIIYNEARKNHLSPELIAAVARAESGFHPTARSQSGAVGLMQLIPRTGRWLGATDLTDPTQNIVAGAKYLAYLSDRFGGNEDHVIAAYNAGEGNVRRFDGVPPFKETRDYVERVQRFQRDLRARMEGQVTDLGIGWSRPASDLQRLDAMPARSRPKIDIHWTTREERRRQKQRS
jgi:soluble lytic murein transglycosylase-like protein